MRRTHASIALVVISAVLALLLLTGVIQPVVAGAVFAFTLATLGVLSRGFRG